MSIAKIISLVVVIAIIAIAGAATFTSIKGPSYPKFSYNGDAPEGWWKSDNINVQKVAGRDYKGAEPIEKLPVADLTVRHGDKDAKTTPQDNCFTLFSYYNYALEDTKAAYDEYMSRKNDAGTVIELESLTKTIATFEGEKEYQLHRYDFSEENTTALSGYQIGFIPLSEGYIRTEGVCKTADDLALLLPSLEAVSLLGP